MNRYLGRLARIVSAGFVVAMSVVAYGAFTPTTYPVFDVMAYPGVDSTGASFSTTGLQSAFTAASAGGGIVRFPCGTFKTAALTANLASNAALDIEMGACTELFFSGGNGLTVNYGNQYSSLTVNNGQITTDQVGTKTGLSLNLTNGLSNEYGPVNTLNNVVFQGHDFKTTNTAYWSTAFLNTGVTNINFNGGSCNMLNNVPTLQPVGTCYSVAGYGSGTNPYAVVFNFTNVAMNGCNTALKYGEWVQGVTMTASNVTGCLYGVSTGSGISSTSDVLDQLTITASQFNTYACGVCINDQYFNDFISYGNLFIVDSSTWTPAQGSTGMYVQGVGWIISNNQMGDVNQGTDIAIDIASGFASGGLAEGNYMTSFGSMFYITASNAQAHLVNNKFFDYSNKSTDYGLTSGAGAILIEDYQPRTYATLSGSTGSLPCTYAVANSRMVLADWNGGSYNAGASGGGTGLTNIMCQCLGAGCTGSWNNH